MAFVDDMKSKIQSVKDREKALLDQARTRTPQAYHDFLLLLDQNFKVNNKGVQNPDQFGPGVWASEKGTFVSIRVPYVAVDGRVRMAIDEHAAKEGKLEVEFDLAWTREAVKILTASDWQPDQAVEVLKLLPEELKNLLVATVSSSIYGRFEGTAKINWEGMGVDRTNPFENAQTSALGRALGNMGYGIIGSGIASFEEVRGALEEQAASETTTPRSSTPPPAPRPAPPTTTSAPAPSEAQNTPPAPTPTAEPMPAPDGNDPAITLESGPCADCGGTLSNGMAKFIQNQRKQGKAVRWSHRSVPGLDDNGKCKELKTQ